MPKNIPLINREISWLSFNDRVLQEAADKSVPLVERIRFLAIFSSNLDEFYRVRVATLNRLSSLNTKAKELLGFNPRKTLNEIKNIVVQQEHKFNHLYRDVILKELEQQKIFIINEQQLNVSRGLYVKNYFREKVLSTLVPVMIDKNEPFPELKDRAIYFFVRLVQHKSLEKSRLALIEIPTDGSNRFLVLPETNKLKFITLIDDIIRYCLDEIFFIFKYDQIESYSIQLTRDAELNLDKHVSDKFIEALTKSLNKRSKGRPMRLLYDKDMPLDMVNYLVDKLDLSTDGLIPGNRYHNFKDFISFPNVGDEDLEYLPMPSLPVQGLSIMSSIFAQIAKRDYLINLPYQSFDYIIHFLREAAIDPKVKEISITLYRLAENSRVIHALINAAKNGKKVYCFLELKARFDEQANIYWTNRLEEEGVIVNYGILDYKVHSKICLVKRHERGKDIYYSNLATGNFNEKTAKLYGDHSLFTANPEINSELVKLFEGLHTQTFYKGYKHLIVSPLESRQKLNALINREIKNAKAGMESYIILKMNSLTDEDVIAKLYEANNAGVSIKLIIRGMCCLVPGVVGFSERIEVISIIDRFLEHARVWIFANSGDEKVYLTSADIMARNLDHRVEVGFPILDQEVKLEILKIIDIQLKDNSKAREINKLNNNRYRKTKNKVPVRAQTDIYHYLKYKK
jgi:polyphosphate kinase